MLSIIKGIDFVVSDRISRQNEMIQNATRTVAETEEVGEEITAELARNREKINSSRAKVLLLYYIVEKRSLICICND